MKRFYRTKPCEIEAIQWEGTNVTELLDWGKGNILWDDQDNLYIDTLEGRMRANIGDYIIKGLRGEFYPCKPDVFKKKYEEVKIVEYQCSVLAGHIDDTRYESIKSILGSEHVTDNFKVSVNPMLPLGEGRIIFENGVCVTSAFIH